MVEVMTFFCRQGRSLKREQPRDTPWWRCFDGQCGATRLSSETTPGCPFGDDAQSAPEPDIAQFTPKLRAVVATHRPTPLEQGMMRLKNAPASAEGIRCGAAKPAPDGIAANTKPAHDGFDRGALFVQANGLIINLALATPSRPAALLGAGHRRWLLRRNYCGCGGVRCGPHILAAAFYHLEQGAAAILQQVPAVCHLYGVGHGPARGISKRATTIAADDLGSRMRSEPVNQRVGIAIGQEIDNTMPLKINKNGPVAVAAAPSPFVNPKHAWCLGRCFRRLLA